MRGVAPNQEIFDSVCVAIGKSCLETPPDKITSDSKIDDDLGAQDSFFWIDLLGRIAAQFRLPSFTGHNGRKLETIRRLFPTVGDLCDLVEARLCEKTQAA